MRQLRANGNATTANSAMAVGVESVEATMQPIHNPGSPASSNKAEGGLWLEEIRPDLVLCTDEEFRQVVDGVTQLIAM